MKLFEKTNIPILTRALNAYSARHKAIASNIANVNTPGYRAQRIAFEQQLAQAISNSKVAQSRTHENHIPLTSTSAPPALSDATVEFQDGDPLASGVNNVDIDMEMAELAKNQIRFKFAARLLADAFKGIQKSIRGQLS